AGRHHGDAHRERSTRARCRRRHDPACGHRYRAFRARRGLRGAHRRRRFRHHPARGRPRTWPPGGTPHCPRDRTVEQQRLGRPAAHQPDVRRCERHGLRTRRTVRRRRPATERPQVVPAAALAVPKQRRFGWPVRRLTEGTMLKLRRKPEPVVEPKGPPPITDHETGLLLLPEFRAHLEREISRGLRYACGGALALFDVRVVVAEGEGGSPLPSPARHVAHILREEARAADIAARLDLATFAVLLINADTA